MAKRRARNLVHGLAGGAASAIGLLAAMGCGGGACAACPGCLGAGGVAAGLLLMKSIVRAVRPREKAGVDRPTQRAAS
jgi:hypothetical protein